MDRVDLQLLRLAVRLKRIALHEAQDVLLIVGRSRGGRSADEVLLARGYLTADDLRALRAQIPQRAGSAPNGPSRETQKSPERPVLGASMGSALVAPGEFQDSRSTGEALANGVLEAGTVVTARPRRPARGASGTASLGRWPGPSRPRRPWVSERATPAESLSDPPSSGRRPEAGSSGARGLPPSPSPADAHPSSPKVGDLPTADPGSEGAPPGDPSLVGYRTAEWAPPGDPSPVGYRTAEGAPPGDPWPVGYRFGQGAPPGDPSLVGYRIGQEAPPGDPSPVGYLTGEGPRPGDPSPVGYRTGEGPPSGDPSPVGYRIEGCVARGKNAVVYRAEEIETGRVVALWVPRGPPETVDLALQAAGPRLLVAARLNHPSLVRVLDLGRVEGRHFIALEHVLGVTLEERVATDGPLPILTALEVLRDVARGLAAIHGAGELHDDLRPDRVLVEPTGRARLLGLGLPGRTASGPIGWPALFAPERFWGARPGPSTDLYALGGLLFVALVGRLPYDPVDARALTTALDGTTPDVRQARPEVPKDVAELVQALLQPTAEARPRSAAEVADRLERAVARAEVAEGGARTARLRPSWGRVGIHTALMSLAVGVSALALHVILGEGAEPATVLGGALGCGGSIALAGLLELIRQGQVPVRASTALLVRLRDGAALVGSGLLLSGAFGQAVSGLDVLLAAAGLALLVAWSLGAGLRTEVARARPDAGRGRTLAVLGDLRLRRFRRVVLPATALVVGLAVARWLLIAYFSGSGVQAVGV